MEKKKSKRLIFAIAAVMLIVSVIVIVMLLHNKKESYRVIKIYELDGVAFVQRDGIDDLEPYPNMLLESGDTVRVDSGSMTLKLDEDKYVYVEPETEFEIIAEGTSEKSKTTIQLKKGAITNEIQNKLTVESAYEVNTPNSTMAVRGTVFRVAISYDEKGVCFTKVSTLEGSVVSRLVYSDGKISDKEVMVEHGYEVIIYQDDKDTDYLTDVEQIDFSNLPQSLQDKFEDLIEELMQELGIGEEKEDTNKKSEYIITFMYNGSVFGTQTVKAGACATKPSLLPSTSGSWNYDFTKPVEADITIEWK